MDNRAPVEGKVNSQAIGHGAGLAFTGFLLWLLGVLVWNQPADAQHAVQAAAAVPAPVIGMVLLVPVGIGYLCGYLAKHSPRPVLPGKAVIQLAEVGQPLDPQVVGRLVAFRTGVISHFDADGDQVAEPEPSATTRDDAEPAPPDEPIGEPDPDPSQQRSQPYMGGG